VPLFTSSGLALGLGLKNLVLFTSLLHTTVESVVDGCYAVHTTHHRIVWCNELSKKSVCDECRRRLIFTWLFIGKHVCLLVITALRYAYRYGLCCRPVSVRLSDCPPSITFVYCIQTAEDIVKPLSRSSSHIILVFWLKAPVPNSKGTYSVVVQNTRGVKNCDFRLKSPYISDMVRDSLMVATENNRKS